VRWAVCVTALVAVLVGLLVRPTPAATTPQFVLSPENNHLWAYDAATGARQILGRAVDGPDPGMMPPNGLRRDINGQVCISPDNRHIITGEDTVLSGGGEGGSSHDPRIAGWGFYEIAGAALGELTIDQTGKLAPEGGKGPGYTGDPDNYGCGFLDGNRLFTTAIGNTLPGEPANGQLFLWFAPFTSEFRQETDTEAGVSFFVGSVDHCQIDDTLATAGGIAIDTNGDVYVTANRPDDDGNPGAVWRYRGTWPSTAAECTASFLAANITKEQVVPAVPGLPADPMAPTPSSVLISPAGTLYVASVFSGTVSEYSKDGVWIRDLFPLSPVTPRTGPTGNTPFGLAVTADATLWIADLGIVVGAPVPEQGSLIRLPFAEGAPVLPAETVQDGLTFPDGLGVYTPSAAPSVPPTTAAVVAAADTGRGGTLAATGAGRTTGLLGGAVLALLLALRYCRPRAPMLRSTSLGRSGSVTTSMTLTTPDARARSRAGRRSSGDSTRSP
jgi:hypothetical protein